MGPQIIFVLFLVTQSLQISGTGWVLLSHRAYKAPPESSGLYSCYLSTRDVRAFIQVVQKHPFWNFDTTRWDPEPNETNIHFRLMDTSQGFAWDTQIWSFERQRQTGVSELMRVIDLVIAKVSDNQIRIQT